jgi:Protein of unknown function (DUF541)
MRTAVLLLACASACLAQLEDNTVTVTVSRNVTVQPDQAVLNITVTSPTDADLADVLGAFQGIGLTADDLTYVDTRYDYTGTYLEWQFSKAVAFSDLKMALAAVAAAQKQQNSFGLTYFVQSQVSQAAQQAPALCPIPTLFADAQAQAQQIASAAGVRAGAVVSISQGVAETGVLSLYDFVRNPFVIYDPTTGVSLGSSYVNFLLAPPAAPVCSLTVQFKLVH